MIFFHEVTTISSITIFRRHALGYALACNCDETASEAENVLPEARITLTWTRYLVLTKCINWLIRVYSLGSIRHSCVVLRAYCHPPTHADTLALSATKGRHQRARQSGNNASDVVYAAFLRALARTTIIGWIIGRIWLWEVRSPRPRRVGVISTLIAFDASLSGMMKACVNLGLRIASQRASFFYSLSSSEHCNFWRR